MKVCVTGHRPNKLWGYNYEAPEYIELKQTFKKYLKENHVTEGISGMALGVDTIFALAIIELKEEGYPIKLHCAIPCLGQEKMWPQQSQNLYNEILSKADIVKVVTNANYNQFVMQKRNRYMVDLSDRVLAVWDGSRGGTGNAVQYAREESKIIDRIYPRKPFEIKEEKQNEY